jgi:hypothetical protein
MSIFHKINLVFQKIKNKLLSFEKLDEKIDSEKEIILSVFRINNEFYYFDDFENSLNKKIPNNIDFSVLVYFLSN